MIAWSDTFRAGTEAVRAHRLRSLLTALGILIGIASVVLTVGLGLGAQRQVQDQIAALGSNLLIVSPGSSTDSRGVRGGFGSGTTLTTADANALADNETAPDVARVVPVSTSNQVLRTSAQNWTTELSGTNIAWPEVRGRKLASGRFFTLAEAEAGTQLTVIGVLAATGATGTDASENDMALVPLATAFQVSGSSSTAVSNLYIQASSKDSLPAAYQEVQNTLTNLHGVTSTSRDFTIATQSSLIQTANATNRTMTVLLAGVAAISLLVGGIGVMNIMLVSVTERIREIGLRKALGGTPRAIRRQFLVEAGVLGLLGGIAGVAVGVLGAIALPHLIDQPVTLSGLAIGTALLVSLGLGIAFGVYPASRAANLLPIQALRND